jgi:hypothetical protein
MALLAVALSAGWAGAATYYVDGAGAQAADANPGSQEKPWKTLGRAVQGLKAGDTVILKGGVYRETLRLAASGEKDKPITIKAAPGERVIITGADPITGWKKCAKADLPGNPNVENIFVVDLDWQPAQLIESSSKRVAFKVARLPKEGWWPPTKAEGRRVFYDDANLTQTDPKAWDGWTIAALYSSGGGVERHTDFAFDPQAHKITLAKDWSQYADIDPKRDTYYMENHPSAIGGPGVYAFKKTDKGLRYWVWPTKLQGQEPQVEGVRRTEVVTPNSVSFVVLDGLEICFSANQGIGHNVKLSDSVIQNCYLHDCAGYGIGLYPGERVTIRHNIFREVSNGIVLLSPKDVTVEENDVGWCLVDGLDAADGVRNLTIARNIFHNNFRFGHPDNIQFWTDVDGLVIQDNVLLNGGQSVMSSNLRNARFVNNLIIGSHAVALIVGGESGGPVYNMDRCTPEERTKRLQTFETCEPDHIEVRHNTICGSALQPTGFWGSGFTVTSNILAPLHESPMYSVGSLRTMKADYNVLGRSAASKKFLIIVYPIQKAAAGDKETLDMKGDFGTVSLEMLRDKWGLEKHGSVGEPKFVNAPKFYIVSHYGYVSACTRTKLITWGKVAGNIAVGDNVEIAFDGRPRKVTEVGEYEGQGYVIFDPPLAAIPEFSVPIANWGAKTDLTWDLRLRDDSPGKKAAEDGSDAGSNINLQSYMKGDFNGDGKRDLPELPKD